ncbi:hypothetical protein HOLleu_06434 [Holothuria leucospilota]|uniref:Uncharacterized protein n=1 Tax=Holothuria leucospilota TaxID=206669 RepID=A0A9Q1CMU7_HOLLE|nr:hypothetical protein HOLleu_06434 [Holothuria leucospilota]
MDHHERVGGSRGKAVGASFMSPEGKPYPQQWRLWHGKQTVVYNVPYVVYAYAITPLEILTHRHIVTSSHRHFLTSQHRHIVTSTCGI